MAEHGYNYYVKIWVYLMVLLVISIVGPTFEILVVTLITAFGVAVVKALMVAAWYLHLSTEKKYIWLLLIGALIFMGGLFIGVAPDIMNKEGTLWKRCNAYNDHHRARIAREVKVADEHHGGFAGMGIPHEVDCTPQRF